MSTININFNSAPQANFGGSPALAGGGFPGGLGFHGGVGFPNGVSFGGGTPGAGRLDPVSHMLQQLMGLMTTTMATLLAQQVAMLGNSSFSGGTNGNGLGSFLGQGPLPAASGATAAALPQSGSSSHGSNTMTPASSTGTIDRLSDNKDERLKQVVDAAKRTFPNQPHLAKLAAAQAVHESGLASSNGPSGLAKNHNNLFGIKGSGTAGTVNMQTGEHLNGRDVTINAGFAKNATLEDSFQQHKNLLNKSRYSKVVSSQSFEQAAQEVRAAGYATDPSYTQKLISTYNTHLARFF